MPEVQLLSTRPSARTTDTPFSDFLAFAPFACFAGNSRESKTAASRAGLRDLPQGPKPRTEVKRTARGQRRSKIIRHDAPPAWPALQLRNTKWL